MQQNWEQRTAFYNDEEVKNQQQFLDFLGGGAIKAKKYLLDWIMDKTKGINEKSSFKTRIYMILHNMNEIPKCKTCGKDFNVDIVNRTSGFSVFCGPACVNRDKDIRRKIANTNT